MNKQLLDSPELTTKDFFFCYDRKKADYLRYEKKIKYITAAKHITSGNVFYLFERTPELEAALKDNQ